LDNLVECLKGDLNGRMRKHLGDLKLAQHDLLPLLKIVLGLRDFELSKRVSK
jgi:hypothetical protein